MAVKTYAQLINEIAVSLPDNVIGQITPSILRSFETDIVDTMFNLNPINSGQTANWSAIQNFNAGFSVSGIEFTTWTYTAGTDGPNIVLYNGFTTTAGSSTGGGLIFNCNNSAGTFHTAAYINGGYVDNTSGHEKGLIDFAVYQGFTGNTLICSIGCNDSAFWWAPGVDATCSLGLAGFRWTNVYSQLFTGPGGTTPIFTTQSGITSGAASNTGTLTNAPAVGNPTKWIPINDNGTTRYIPAW